MSAGSDIAAAAALIRRDLGELAPRFRAAVEAALADCARAGRDAYVFEALRTDKLARLYYKRGRPPTEEFPRPVTYAKDALSSWHGYGLAVDVISRARGWFHPLPIANPTPAALQAERVRAAEEGRIWFRDVATIFKAHGCDWGGDWPKRKDPPHFQFGTLKPSPSQQARDLLAAGGVKAVWRAVGAL
jgi:peptidoglycan L-alanyl-D-glutamate endopeptidase CwlK